MEFLKTFDAVDWAFLTYISVSLIVVAVLLRKVSREMKKLDQEH